HRKRVRQITLRERPHRTAAVRLVVHAAELLEVAQRLAHRRLAAVQLAGDLRLDEPLARRVLARHDALQDALLDLVAQDDLLQRASPFVFHAPCTSGSTPRYLRCRSGSAASSFDVVSATILPDTITS